MTRPSSIAVAATCLTLLPLEAADAGAPYLTDDPGAGPQGLWELLAFSDHGLADGEVAGAAGLDLNYSVRESVQLTLVVSGEYPSGDRAGPAFADTEVSVKYRFLGDSNRRVQAAIVPTLTLPTAPGPGRAAVSLPVWVQAEAGPWTVFGGGGPTLQRGPGTKDYWQQGIAVTRDLGQGTAIGLEAFHSGAEAPDERGSAALSLGATHQLSNSLALAASAGPVFEDRTGRTGAHGYLALVTTF